MYKSVRLFKYYNVHFTDLKQVYHKHNCSNEEDLEKQNKFMVTSSEYDVHCDNIYKKQHNHNLYTFDTIDEVRKQIRNVKKNIYLSYDVENKKFILVY